MLSHPHMSGNRLEADVGVKAFGLTLDGATHRLDFPRAQLDGVKGSSGDLSYAAREVSFERLRTRLDRTDWRADAASAGGVTLRTADGAIELAIGRVELSRGVSITQAAEGIELYAPHASFQDVELRLPRLAELAPHADRATTAIARAVDASLRQEKLHVLDSLSGEIKLTVRVVLDLPVLGRRTLDQPLRIPIKDGSLDYRALEGSLDWLEGRFVDLAVKNGRLVLSWKMPVFGRAREIVAFELDEEAKTLSVFERVPLRSLADVRTAPADPTPKKPGRSVVESLTLSGLSIDLAMAAPRSVEIGNGTLQFGGEAEPGIVGLSVRGDLPGGLTGSIALLDVTAKDVGLGPVTLTVDRLHLGAIEPVELRFDQFSPSGLTAHIHRVSASNLSLHIR